MELKEKADLIRRTLVESYALSTSALASEARRVFLQGRLCEQLGVATELHSRKIEELRLKGQSLEQAHKETMGLPDHKLVRMYTGHA